MDKQIFILKVLSGAHIGAEIILSEQETTLGSGEDCDLVLGDVSLAEKHISLAATTDGVMLKVISDGSSSIYIDGEKLEQKQITLQAFQVVAIGTLFLATGPDNKPWPAIDLLLENKLEKLSPSVNEDEVVDPNTTEGEEESEEDLEKSDDETSSSLEDATQETSQAPTEVVKQKRTNLYLLSIAVVVFISFVGMIFWFLSPDVGLEMRMESKKQAEEERQVILFSQDEKAKIGLLAKQYRTSLEIEKNAQDGILEVVGYAENDFQRQEIIKQIIAIKPNISIRIATVDDTLSSIKIILNRFLANKANSHVVPVSVQPTGTFILQGYVDDDKDWSEALAVLKRDIKNYYRLKDQVETKNDRIVVLQGMLENAKLANSIKVQKSPKGLILAGTLPDETQRTKLLEIKNTFNQKFNKLPWVDWVNDSSKHKSSIKLDIRAVGFGKVPHLTLRNGRRYTIGSSLNNGYTIEAITPKFIALRKDKRIAYYYLHASK